MILYFQPDSYRLLKLETFNICLKTQFIVTHLYKMAINCRLQSSEIWSHVCS